MSEQQPGSIAGNAGIRSETDRRSKTADRPNRKRVAYTKQQNWLKDKEITLNWLKWIKLKLELNFKQLHNK